MKSLIKILGISGKTIPITVTTFPGGEVNVSLDPNLLSDPIRIKAWLHDTEGFMVLAQVKSILDQYGLTDVVLDLGYVPYARQDRICNTGESLAIKVFANLLNSLEFKEVNIIDPHSDVTPALINNVKILDKEYIIRNFMYLDHYDVLVAPDAGAAKEVQKLAIKFGLEFIQGVKQRDTKTGELSGFDYHSPYVGSIKDKRVLVVDDLCDGGGTFIGLGNKLLEGKPTKLDLYVTHGMFTKGINDLLNVYHRIHTTNTYISDIYKNHNINCVIKL